MTTSGKNIPLPGPKCRWMCASIPSRLAVFIIGLFIALSSAPVIADREPWDLGWLLDVDPTAVSEHALLARAQKLEQEHQRFHQYNGIVWVADFRDSHDANPAYFGSGSDSCLFTGFYLAAATYRFMVTHSEADLDIVLETLRGLHILSHISGIPGVIARNAFPLGRAAEWRYPEKWQFRIKQGYMYESPDNIPDVLDPAKYYPKMMFYTKGTRDQLTGMLFGLAVAMGNLRKPELDNQLHLRVKITKCLEIIDIVGTDIFRRLKSTRFVIKDHQGATGTTAKKVSGLLKLQLLALYKEIVRARGSLYADEYKKVLKSYNRQFGRVLTFKGLENFLQPIIGDYYAWNLRLTRVFSIWGLEEDSKPRRRLVRYTEKRIWKYVRHHENTHFTFLFNRMKGQDFVNVDDAVLSLRRYYFRPMRSWSSPLVGKERMPNVLRRLFRADKQFVVPAHLRRFAKFFLWHKNPYSVGKELDRFGQQRSSGLSYLLPYWMGRYFGFLPTP